MSDIDDYDHEEVAASFAERAAADGQPGNQATAQGNGWTTNPARSTALPSSFSPEKTGKQRAPKPKLDFQILKRDNGIPEVFKSFRQSFKQQTKGKGHEVGDLGRLLAMYERWHARIFPHCDFDQFLGKVDRMYGRPGGRSDTGSVLKGEVRELRDGVVQLALDLVEKHRQHPAASHGAAPADEDARAQAAAGSPDASHAGSQRLDAANVPHPLHPGMAAVPGDQGLADDTEELISIQKQSREYWDDDELDDMMVGADVRTQGVPGGRHPAASCADAADDDDDWCNDDMDAMMVDVEPAGAQAAASTAAHRAVGEGGVPGSPSHVETAVSGVRAPEADARGIGAAEPTDERGVMGIVGDVDDDMLCAHAAGMACAPDPPLCLDLDTMPGDE